MSHDPQRSGWCKLHCNKPCWIAVCSDNAEPFSEHYRTISIFIDFPFASKEAEAEVAWQHPAVGFLLGKVINGRDFFLIRIALLWFSVLVQAVGRGWVHGSCCFLKKLSTIIFDIF